jgi:hypothetical protein
MGHDTVAVPPKLSVAESDSYFVAVQADIYGVTRADTTVDDTTYTILTVPEYGYTTEVGKPMVPVVTALVAVPDSVDISLSLAAYDYTTMQDILIYPVPKESVACDTCCCFEVFTKDSATYNTDAFYPGTLAELDTTSHLRSQRIAQIKMYPIQFNPVDAVVKAYHYLRPELTLSGNPVENTVGLGPFEKIGRRCLLNYKPNSTVIEDTTGDVHIITDPKDTTTIADYLIVIADSLWGHGDYDTLAEWRADHNYFDVGFIKLKKIMKAFCPDDTLYYPAPDDECLKDFFEYAYEHYRAPQMPDSHLGYVLLVGDIWDADAEEDTFLLMPSHLDPGVEDTTASDVWYSCLGDSGDVLPEFAIGRFPAQDSSEVSAVSVKTFEYEEPEEGPSSQAWRRDVILAHDEYLYPTWYFPLFVESGYDTILVPGTLSGSEWLDSLENSINRGTFFVAHNGHEDYYQWQGPDDAALTIYQVDDLSNGGKLPFAMGVGCKGGDFNRHNARYLAASFLKNSLGGSVAYTGSSKYGYTRGKFFEYCVSAIMDDQEWIVGHAMTQARVRIAPDHTFGFNLFGDPALDMGDYTACPDDPDLVVRSKHLSLGPDYPSFGDSLIIQVRIFNVGSGDADTFVVTVQDTFQQQGSTIGVDTIPELGARKDTLLEFTWDTSPDTMYDIGTHKIAVWVDSDSAVDESWEDNNTAFVTEHIFFYPNEDGWPQKTGGAVRSSPALADLFDDSKLEVVIGSDDHCLYVYPTSGDLEDGWVDTTCAPVWTSPAVGDINDDGPPEVIVAADNSLYVWDTAGVLLTDWPIELCDTTDIAYTVALADVDSDDTLDIVVPADSSVYILRYDASSLSGWPVSVPGAEKVEMSAPAVADVDGDDPPEIFVSAHRAGTGVIPWDTSYVYAWDDTGAALTGWPPDKVVGSWNLSPALANLDDSGDWEIMTGLGDSMFVWDDSGNRVSGWPPEEGAPPTPVSSSPAVGNLYPSSSGYEVIVGCEADGQGRGRICAWESDGDVIPVGIWPKWTEGGVRSSPALANIDSTASSPDTLLEVIVGSDGGYVYAINYLASDLSNFPFPTRGGVLSSPAIADIDGDGHLELVVGCEDGYIFVWFLEESDCATYAAPWPMFKHDRQRTAWMEYSP